MARILFAWELGGGLGHVIPHLRLIDRLRNLGHEVVFALRDTAHAARLLVPRGVCCLQSPVRVRPVTRSINPVFTYADLLYNCGFDESDALRDRVEAWRSLFELARPDMTVFDHSPTALLAARGFSFTKVIGGTGFTTPPDVSPLPVLRELNGVAPADLYKREIGIWMTINDVLRQLRLKPIDRLTELFAVDVVAFQTFSELDHYADRPGGRYFGYAPQPIGSVPNWPDTPGKKIFAYLKLVPGLPKLLALLQDLEQATLVYIDGADASLIRRFESRTLAFANEPVDMRAAATQCEYAVHHGGHGTVVDLLLAGHPMLLLPITLEQLLMSQRVQQLSAGLSVTYSKVSAAQEGLQELLEEGASYAVGAQAFATRYRNWSANTQTENLVRLLGEHLDGGSEVMSGAKVAF